MTESVVAMARALLERERVDITTRPGQVQSTAVLHVHTEPARRLVLGRRAEEGQPIVGLFLFAPRVKRIMAAARQGDVYAQWYLIRIEQRLDEGRESLNTLQATVDAQVRQRAGVTVTIQGSDNPLAVPLDFGNPYAYQGADLIAAFDNSVQGIIVGQRMGRLPMTTVRQLLHEGGRAIRRIFQLAPEWKPLEAPVTREDVHRQTDVAKAAAEKMGEVPADVVAGERKPEWVLIDE